MDELEAKRQLAENNKKKKLLDQQNKELYKYLKKESTEYITYGMLKDLSLKTYETLDDEEIQLVDILEDVLENLHNKSLEFYEENKNKSFPYDLSSKLYDDIQGQSLIQRRLARQKHIQKKNINRTRTPNQYLNTVWAAKESYVNSVRIGRMEEKLARLEAEMSARLETLETKQDELSNKLKILAEDQDKAYKVQIYLLKQSGLTYRQIADDTGIGESTARKYVRQIKDELDTMVA